MNLLDGNSDSTCEATRFTLALVQRMVMGGADIALLPECMDLGWTHPSCLAMAEEIPGGEACQALMQAAAENEIYVCSGLTDLSSGV